MCRTFPRYRQFGHTTEWLLTSLLDSAGHRRTLGDQECFDDTRVKRDPLSDSSAARSPEAQVIR